MSRPQQSQETKHTARTSHDSRDLHNPYASHFPNARASQNPSAPQNPQDFRDPTDKKHPFLRSVLVTVASTVAIVVVIAIVCAICAIASIRSSGHADSSAQSSFVDGQTVDEKTEESSATRHKTKVPSALTGSTGLKVLEAQSRSMRVPIDWRKSSQTTPYPRLTQVKNLWIRVSILDNRTYVMSGDTVIYTMYSSAGAMHKKNVSRETFGQHEGQKKDRQTDQNTDKQTDQRENQKTDELVSDTPTGTFHVEQERGDHFYSDLSHEGGNWWVSWKDHGIYLFHSVPIDQQGNYEEDQARLLGKKPASHGCIRLSVSDAKWLYEQLPVGTKVVIKNK